MMRIGRIVWLCLLYAAPSLESDAQSGSTLPCNEVERMTLDDDPVQRKILFDFIVSCENKEWKNDKGIVMLTRYTDSNGKQCWWLVPSIDDRYKDNPPKKFATFNGDIILIFEADSLQRVKPVSGDMNRINTCLEKIIGDRVYSRPSTKTRWADGTRPFTTEKIKEGRRRLRAGNGGDVIIIFNGDGTYKKLLPV